MHSIPHRWKEACRLEAFELHEKPIYSQLKWKIFFKRIFVLFRNIAFHTCRTFLGNRRLESWQCVALNSKYFSPHPCSCRKSLVDCSRRDIGRECRGQVHNKAHQVHRFDVLLSICIYLDDRTTFGILKDVVRPKVERWMKISQSELRWILTTPISSSFASKIILNSKKIKVKMPTRMMKGEM